MSQRWQAGMHHGSYSSRGVDGREPGNVAWCSLFNTEFRAKKTTCIVRS